MSEMWFSDGRKSGPHLRIAGLDPFAQGIGAAIWADFEGARGAFEALNENKYEPDVTVRLNHEVKRVSRVDALNFIDKLAALARRAEFEAEEKARAMARPIRYREDW